MGAASQMLVAWAAKYAITVADLGGGIAGYANSVPLYGGLYGACVTTTQVKTVEIHGLVAGGGNALIVDLGNASLPQTFFTKVSLLDGAGVRQEFLTAAAGFTAVSGAARWYWSGTAVWAPADAGEIKIVEFI